MTTPLRAGSKVHGGELAELGFIGTPCRYKGEYVTAVKERGLVRVYVMLTDGSVRWFRPLALHHERDCKGELR